MPTAPTTRLEAVNRMLSNIGYARVGSLPQSEREDVDEAEATLDEVTREVLTQGWNFNRDDNYELTPNGSNEIVVAATVARIKVPPIRHGKRIAHRDGKLYDRENNTFEFTHPVRADIVWLLAFDKIPQSARWYITVKAARQFANRMLAGEPGISEFSEADERDALAVLKDDEGESAYHSMFDSPDIAFTVIRGRLW